MHVCVNVCMCTIVCVYTYVCMCVHVYVHIVCVCNCACVCVIVYCRYTRIHSHIMGALFYCQVVCMNVYDIALDFVLMDAFTDLAKPPSTVVAALQNRWLTDRMKETVCTYSRTKYWLRVSACLPNSAGTVCCTVVSVESQERNVASKHSSLCAQVHWHGVKLTAAFAVKGLNSLLPFVFFFHRAKVDSWGGFTFCQRQ